MHDRRFRALAACATVLGAVASVGGAALAAHPRGGTYRATARHKSEALTVSADGKTISGYSLNVPERCSHTRGLGQAHANRAGGSGPPSIPVASDGSFHLHLAVTSTYANPGKVYSGVYMVKLNGRFTTSLAAQAKLRITFRASAGTFRCNSGMIRFTARR